MITTLTTILRMLLTQPPRTPAIDRWQLLGKEPTDHHWKGYDPETDLDEEARAEIRAELDSGCATPSDYANPFTRAYAHRHYMASLSWSPESGEEMPAGMLADEDEDHDPEDCSDECVCGHCQDMYDGHTQREYKRLLLSRGLRESPTAFHNRTGIIADDFGPPEDDNEEPQNKGYVCTGYTDCCCRTCTPEFYREV